MRMNVLVGIVGSDESIKTLRQTIDRTHEVGDDLTVAVVDKPEAKRSQDAMAERAGELVAEAGVDADIVQLEGDTGS